MASIRLSCREVQLVNANFVTKTNSLHFPHLDKKERLEQISTSSQNSCDPNTLGQLPASLTCVCKYYSTEESQQRYVHNFQCAAILKLFGMTRKSCVLLCLVISLSFLIIQRLEREIKLNSSMWQWRDLQADACLLQR